MRNYIRPRIQKQGTHHRMQFKFITMTLLFVGLVCLLTDFRSKFKNFELVCNVCVFFVFHVYIQYIWPQNTLTASLYCGKTPPTSVLDMTLNNLMVRLHYCWIFGECWVPPQCHCSQVHSDPEWLHLIDLWIK